MAAQAVIKHFATLNPQKLVPIVSISPPSPLQKLNTTLLFKKKFYLNWQGRSQYFSLPHVSSNGLGNLESAQFVGSGTGKGAVEE